MEEKLRSGKTINDETPIYRYLQFTQFASMIESNSIYVSKVSSWDDPWEGILTRLPLCDNEGRVHKPLVSSLDYMYGQCWSLLPESDALWRIYSPHKEGIQIKTRVYKLGYIKGYKRAIIDRVEYYDDLRSVDLNSVHFYGYLLKRKAFEHEAEVRLLIDWCDIENEVRTDYIELEVDLSDFIEEVIIDPRAAEWFVRMVTSYCKKNGIDNVKKSKLYTENIFEETQLKLQLIDATYEEV